MINSKLLEIIRGLNASEFYRLGLFLRSPYFYPKGIPEDEQQLFFLLESAFPDFEAEDLNKHKVYTVLYPEGDFVKGKLEKRMSALLKKVEHFLGQELNNKEGNEFSSKLNLAKFYRDKGISRLYEITLNNLEKSQASIARKDKEDLYHDFLLQREIAEFQSFRNTRRKDLNLPATLQALDTFYLAAKLEYSCGLLSQNNFHIPIDVQDSFSILNNITSILQGEHFQNIPLINIYFWVFIILQDMDNLEAYHQLEQRLETAQDQIPLEQLKALQAFCRSFCIRQANRGDEGFFEKSFLLYKKHLEAGYLLHNGGILPGSFRNIVSAGLWQKQFEWVWQFLEDYKGKIIGDKSADEVHRFNLGHYYFELKDYENALNHLAANYQDMYYHIAAKRMEIKVYYEQKSVLFEPKIDAFKIFVHRFSKKKLPETPRLGNTNFINALKQIRASSTKFDPQRIRKLINKIEQQEVIFEKRWLLQKLKELRTKQ